MDSQLAILRLRERDEFRRCLHPQTGFEPASYLDPEPRVFPLGHANSFETTEGRRRGRGTAARGGGGRGALAVYDQSAEKQMR